MKPITLILILLALWSCQSSAQQNNEQSGHANNESLAVFKNIDIDEFEKMMEGEGVVVLDVRTPPETAMGMIEGAIEVDVKNPDFVQQIQKLDKDKTYLIYCRSGRRSVTACNLMAEQGFTKLYNMLGGYNAWSVEKE